MSDLAQIRKLFEDGDRALISADVAELHRIYADDYLQHDETGKPSPRRDLIRNLTSGAIRFLSSTDRNIHLLRDDVAMVHGSEGDGVERADRRFVVNYVYADIVVKRNGR